ncbi:MAG: 4-hydroxythreonine-4-phosphate dehydrogenase PdxA, partial [Pseudomonadota bacterium]
LKEPRLPLALTMGEPAGIGPDITLLAWQARARLNLPPFFVVADPAVLKARAAALSLRVPIRLMKDAHEVPATFAEALPVLPLPDAMAAPGPVTPGRPTAATAQSVIAAIKTATRLVQSGDAAALVTNPIHKAVLNAQGFEFPGHTEFLAALCAEPGLSAPRPVMMLTAGELRVGLVTVHMPLQEVAAALTPEAVIETAQIMLDGLRRDFAIAGPRLAVAALNPHAGEAGMLGVEEHTCIAPAIDALRARGHCVTGPHPADTLFHAEARARYDAVLCQYHDQGLIPVKMLDFYGGVNTTLGLPIVRTSPDHGTAFDLAGTGKARPDSLIAALRLAAEMADTRQRTAF